MDESFKSKLAAKLFPPGPPPTNEEIKQTTTFTPTAPAKALGALVENQGSDITTQALNAWQNRLLGVPVIDIAHGMGVTLAAAKQLIREAHAAVAEDLKESIALNRELDLQRLDGLIRTWYPPACQGDLDSAQVVVKCIQQRGRLTGVDTPDPGRSKEPANVLVWIQNQLPSINRMVDSLPIE